VEVQVNVSLTCCILLVFEFAMTAREVARAQTEGSPIHFSCDGFQLSEWDSVSKCPQHDHSDKSDVNQGRASNSFCRTLRPSRLTLGRPSRSIRVQTSVWGSRGLLLMLLPVLIREMGPNRHG
jgi:hypothetical protein